MENDLQSKFDQISKMILNLKTEPSTPEKLVLYGYYKQVIVGDINISKPWAIYIEASSKYDAWAKNKGMSKSKAIEKYVLYAVDLIKKYQLKE
jgi:diazepam-binding inhibitor (GABA receptor modulator, acyl-CoA-binding protein)